MSFRILVGLDGKETGQAALAFARKLAAQMSGCEFVLVYVIEWSPFSFQTAEENEQRHKRRTEELGDAAERVTAPVVAELAAQGLDATGIVHHGDVADTLMRVATEQSADMIVVGRTSKASLSDRLFGSSAVTLTLQSRIPVTVTG